MGHAGGPVHPVREAAQDRSGPAGDPCDAAVPRRNTTSAKRQRYTLGGPDIPDESVVLPDGRRLTEKVRREIIDQTRDAARKAGRPSLTRPGQHSPQIGVRLSEEDHDRVKRAAEREGITTSEFARRAIAAELERVS